VELADPMSRSPFYCVSIMEFSGVKVAHEMQYLADPFGSARGVRDGLKAWTARRTKEARNRVRKAEPSETSM
jgi:hypothetical protein